MPREMPAVAQPSSDPSLPQYAQVAVPLHLTQTFTYRLPAELQPHARVGSRLLVPFGAKPTTAYIVALLPALQAGTSLVETDIKDAEALLDIEPLLTPDVLEITRWVADYYAAPWGEVLKAALPAGINASVEQVVAITDAGRARLVNTDANASEAIKTPNAGTRGLQ